jgi:hypothetical protein
MRLADLCGECGCHAAGLAEARQLLALPVA